jgi:hypothetical protein
MKRAVWILAFVFSLFLELLEATPLKVPPYDPFKNTGVILKAKVKRDIITHKRAYILYGIFGDRANINGNFYRLGDKVGTCRLSSLSAKGVVLSCRKGVKKLYFLNQKIYKTVEK